MQKRLSAINKINSKRTEICFPQRGDGFFFVAVFARFMRWMGDIYESYWK